MSSPIIFVLLNLFVAAGVCGLLYWMQSRHLTFTKRVFVGLGAGIALGAIFQFSYGANAPIIVLTNSYLDVI